MGIQHIIYRLALKYPGGIRQLADDLGRNYNVFINKLNPNVATHHTYIGELDELVAFLDTDEVAKYFAAQRNMFCVPSPGLDSLSDNALLDLFFGLESEKAQWMERMKESLSNGNVTRSEFAEIKREYGDSIAATAEVMARIELYLQASEEHEARLNDRRGGQQMRAAQLLHCGDLHVSSVHKASLIAKLLIRHGVITLPEQKLWMAVLCNTVGDLMMGEPKGRYQMVYANEAGRNAARFFREGGHVILCDWLGLDPDWVLEVLRDHAGLEV